jgi:hypothetical protein
LFFVDKPYVSDFFKRTVLENAIPVVATKISKEMGLLPGTKIISETEAVQLARETENLSLYTTSENSLSWVTKNLSFTKYPEIIDACKNKAKFRQLTSSLVPDLFFQAVRVEDLGDIQLSELPLPLIIKPATGFMSAGVHMVRNFEEWDKTIKNIKKEAGQNKELYPKEVIDLSTYIIEGCIMGDEFAVDAYFNSDGEAVILNILNHAFSSADDVSDRVYTSSKSIIEKNLGEFTDFISKIGKSVDARNFPVHVELRKDSAGGLYPIEVNPLRFGGWCTTADLTYLAYGFNSYLYFFSQIKPDWSEILKGKDEKLYSIIILDNSTGVPADRIRSFNYEKLLADFEKPLELRKFDYQEYPVFGFLFTETTGKNQSELQYILNSDLTEYI